MQPSPAPLPPHQNMCKVLRGRSWVWTVLGSSHHAGPRTTTLTNPLALMLGVADIPHAFLSGECSHRNLESCLQFASVSPPPSRAFLAPQTYLYINCGYGLRLFFFLFFFLRRLFISEAKQSTLENWKRCHLTALQQYPNPSFIPVGNPSNRNRRECDHCCR